MMVAKLINKLCLCESSVLSYRRVFPPLVSSFLLFTQPVSVFAAPFLSLLSWSRPHVCFFLFPWLSYFLSYFDSLSSGVRCIQFCFPVSSLSLVCLFPRYALCIYVFSLPLLVAVSSAHPVWFCVFC